VKVIVARVGADSWEPPALSGTPLSGASALETSIGEDDGISDEPPRALSRCMSRVCAAELPSKLKLNTILFSLSGNRTQKLEDTSERQLGRMSRRVREFGRKNRMCRGFDSVHRVR
jgi:hypothetical protein